MEVRDLSGNVVIEHAQRFHEIIQSARSMDEALRDVGKFIRENPAIVPVLEGTRKVDFMISSMLISQIPFFLQSQLDAEVFQRFRVEGSFSQWHQQNYETWTRYVGSFFDAHVEALIDYARRSGGVAYFATEVRLMASVDLHSDRDNTEAAVLNSTERIGALAETLGHLSLYQGVSVDDVSEAFSVYPQVNVDRRFDHWMWPIQDPVGPKQTLPAGTIIMYSDHTLDRLEEDRLLNGGGTTAIVDAVTISARD